ncbi:hypothetical protein cypCar_00026880 [Cyprinus carpio]|nr:hypothetical protein cypCar_00026880 [Cyprinus carpio]
MLSLHGFQAFPQLIHGMTGSGTSARDTSLLQTRRGAEGAEDRPGAAGQTSAKDLEEIQQIPPPAGDLPQSACTMEKEGSGFSLTLDTKTFAQKNCQSDRWAEAAWSAERARRSMRMGRARTLTEPKSSDGCLICLGVNPEAVTCSMAGGKLYIQAPVNQPSEAAERCVPIDCQTVNTNAARESRGTARHQRHTDDTQQSGKH